MFEALQASVEKITEFARVYEGWAAPMAFVLAFGESLAFLSLFLPAWAALIAIGGLIQIGHLNFWPIWIAAAIGAALGDWISYW
jgi:membrane protein DedA with SNARE-associated domain